MESDADRSRKEKLRRSSRALRMSIPPGRRAHLSEQICLHLSESKVFRDARSFHAFWPMVDQGEVDLRPLILDAHSRNVDVWLPVVSGKVLKHGLFSGEHMLEKASFGQMEPCDVVIQDRVEPELVILPGLSVDESGNRLGYGGGYYDRFLSGLLETPGKSTFVMVLFQELLADSVPHLPHDVPVDAFVTDEGLTWCNPQRQSV